MYNIVVVGMGHVGLPYALCFAVKNNVTVFDIDQNAVGQFNSGKLPIENSELANFCGDKSLTVRAVSSDEKIYNTAHYVILATPTNYEEHNERMDTSSLTKIAEKVTNQNPHAIIIIKSTVPVGYTAWLSRHRNKKYRIRSGIPSRGSALQGIHHPERIVIGAPRRIAQNVTALFASLSYDKKVES